MSSIEQMARNRLADAYDLRGWKDEANALRSGMPMDSPTVAALDTIAAALREQTPGIHLRALADMLDPVKQAGVLRDAADALPQHPAPPSAPVGVEFRDDIRRAIRRAKVFDDGSDGADAESAKSVVAILEHVLAMQAGERVMPHVECSLRGCRDKADRGTFSECEPYQCKLAKSALTQQPAQAASGMMLVQRVDVERLINATHLTESARLSARRLQALLLDTPPGDDAAGGGHGR